MVYQDSFVTHFGSDVPLTVETRSSQGQVYLVWLEIFQIATTRSLLSHVRHQKTWHLPLLGSSGHRPCNRQRLDYSKSFIVDM